MEARIGLESVADASKNALSTILEAWRLLAKGGALTVAEALRVLYPPQTREPRPPEPELYGELRDALEAIVPLQNGRVPDARRVGKALQKFRGRVCDGRMLDSQTFKGMMRWRVVEATVGSGGRRS